MLGQQSCLGWKATSLPFMKLPEPPLLGSICGCPISFPRVATASREGSI